MMASSALHGYSIGSLPNLEATKHTRIRNLPLDIHRQFLHRRRGSGVDITSSHLRGVHRHRTRASTADVGRETVGLKDGGLTGTKSSSGCSRNRRRSCRETCGRRSVDMDDNMYSTTFTAGICRRHDCLRCSS
ncbi:hypothetical protein L6452_41930 [Arctium lappa]|uniref:Uncharacterized protein n=1 Tax=Arctium lappa TaxID=4217 RepID=A0ACB8XGE8_ARCLA|nr:hypothetical protein L6452_41930 [Arctium lappa]